MPIVNFDSGEIPVASEVPVITAYQAEVFLTEAGLFGAFLALLEAPTTPGRIKIAWRRGLDLRRDNPMVGLMIEQLGLNETQADEMFAAAQSIQAGTL